MSAKPTTSSNCSTSSSKIVNMSNFNTNSSNSSNNAVNSGNGSTKMASRRIFPPEFKLKVLESYHTDAECKGNQRATARKYGIHRRQIQKWLQSENILRLSITNSYRNVKQFHNVTIAAAAAAATPSTANSSTVAGGGATGGNQSQNAKHHDIISSGGSGGGVSPNDSNNNDSNNNVNNSNNNSSVSSTFGGSLTMAGIGVVQASSILSRRKQFSIPKRDQAYHGHQHHSQIQSQQHQQHPQQSSSFKINLVPSPDKGRQNVSFIPLSGKFRTPQCAGASVVPDEKVNEGAGCVAGKNIVVAAPPIAGVAATIKQEVTTTTSLSSSSLSLALEPVVSNVATLSSHHHRHYQQHQQQQQQQQQIRQRQSSEDLSATTTLVGATAVPVHQQQAKQQSPIHPSVLSIEQQNLEIRHKSSGSGGDMDNNSKSGAINTSMASPHPIQRSSDQRIFSTTTPYSSFTSLHNYNSPQYQPFFHQFRQDESYQQQAQAPHHHLTTPLHHQHHHHQQHHHHHHSNVQLQPHEMPYKIILGSPSTSSSACLPCTAADSSPATSELRDYQPISGVSSTAKANYALVGKGSMPSTNYFDVKRESDVSLLYGDNGSYYSATPIDLSLNNNTSRHESLAQVSPRHEHFYGGMSQLETSNSCRQCTPATDSFTHNQPPSLPLPPPSASTSFTCCQSSSSSEHYATTSHGAAAAASVATTADDALNLTQYERRKRHASNDDDSQQRGNAKITKLSPNNDINAMKVKQEPKEQPQKPVKLFKPYALDNEDKDADSIKKTDTINVPDNKQSQKKQDINETIQISLNDKDPIIWNNHPFSMIPPPLHNNRDCYSALVPRQHASSHELSSTAVSSSFHGTTNNNEFTFPIIETRPALFQCSLPHTVGSSTSSSSSSTTTTTPTTTNGSLANSNTSLSPTSSSSSTPPAAGGNTVCWGPKCSPATTSGYDSASGYSDSSDPIFHGSITPPIVIPHHPATVNSSRSLLPSPGTVRLVPETQPVYSVDFKLEPLYYYYDSASISPTSSTSSAAASPTFGGGDLHHVPHYKETHWSAMMANKLSLMAK